MTVRGRMAGTVLDLGSDVGIRNRWFAPESFSHPVKLHLGLLQWIIDRYTSPGDAICDPMAGIGSILLAACQQRNVIAREIEPRWLELLHRNAALVYERAGLLAGRIEVSQADACEPWDIRVDHVVFSPPYALAVGVGATARKGMLDQRIRKAKEAGTSYSRLWERALVNPGANAAFLLHYGEHPAQIGHLRNTAYWQAMQTVYSHAYRALGRGYLVLVLKDHIKDGQRVRLSDETVNLCCSLGFTLQERHHRRVWPMSLWQRRRKEQGLPVVEEEDVLCFRKERM